jgi:hypothetical protein
MTASSGILMGEIFLMRLLLASTLAALTATAGCGGQIITVGNHGDGDSGSEGDDGGPVDDVQVIDTYVPPIDAQPPPDDAPVVVPDTGACLVGLEPCITDSQCCSSFCAGTCQDAPPPSCLPDGDACNGSQPCCSGACVNGICGEVADSGPPVSCSAPTGNACFECLAVACCPQLAACENDAECTQSLACFEGCYSPGMGLSCSQKCNQAYPSPNEAPLTSCAESQCLSSCN